MSRGPSSVRRALGLAPRAGVVVYPLDLNPYQRLLYDAVVELEPNFSIVWVRKRRYLGPLPFLALTAIARLQGIRVIHIHWQRFALTWRGRRLYRLSTLNAHASFRWLAVLGIRIVWTVHNALPHERETANDAAVTRLLSKAAVCTIVHSPDALTELQALGADTTRSAVIPHGPYSEAYPALSREEGRRRLGIEEDRHVFLFFGQIRPYKGVDDLLDAWDLLLRELDDAAPPLLIVAGKCDDSDQRERIERRLSAAGSRFVEGYVPHDDVAAFFAAADWVVLPFRTVTTSGSALLALSLGRAIVAPRIGSLSEMPDSVGLLYDAGGLADALRIAATASQAELRTRAIAAREYADTLSWPNIARATLDVYKKATSGAEA
jgi:glycosyltransferase involved in cell wall biosynthesis